MTELVYPFPDADIVVTDPGQDRSGRDFGLVCVRTKDGAGFLVVPRQVYLFDQGDWAKVEVQAAQRNGLDRRQWAERTEQVRVGLFADLKGHVPPTTEEHSEAQEPDIPPFPKSAWQGLFGDYRDIVGPTTRNSRNTVCPFHPVTSSIKANI